jgi:hypothetical protein
MSVIFQARRDAVRNSLTGSGMSLEAAKRWCELVRSRRPLVAADKRATLFSTISERIGDARTL